MISYYFFLLFQPSHPEQSRCTTEHTHHGNVEERFLGHIIVEQRQPWFLQTAVCTLISAELLGLWTSSLGIPSGESAVAQSSHGTGLQNGQSVCIAGTRADRFVVRRTSNTYGSCGRYCRTCGYSLHNFLSIILSDLLKTC